MKALRSMTFRFFLLFGTIRSLLVQATNTISHHPDSIKKDVSTPPAVFISEEQKQILKNHLTKKILYHHSKDKLERSLQEGDWEFINEFLSTLEIEIPIGSTTEIVGVEFTVETLKCGSFAIGDIETESSGTSTVYDISFLVTGITLACEIDYSYKGNFLVGSGSGVLTFDVSPATSVETILIFKSPDFSLFPPTDVEVDCNTNVVVGDASIDNGTLDFLLGPFLPSIIEPIIEGIICEVFGQFDSIISEILFSFEDILESILEPLSPELLDPLYPEFLLFNTTLSSSTIEYLPLQPFVSVAQEPLTGLINSFLKLLLDEDGDFSIPIMMPIGNGTDLLSFKITGLDTFSLGAISLLSDYTFGSTLSIDSVSVEIELAVLNDDNMTDIVEIAFGANDLVFNFALLMVIEQSLDLDQYFSGFKGLLECITNSIHTFEIAALSLQSADITGLELSGLAETGLEELVNEVSDAAVVLFGSTLIEVASYIYELIVRGVFNEVVAIALGTCIQKFVGRTVNIGGLGACWQIELFDSGTVNADYSSPKCINPNYEGMKSFSIFNGFTPNGATFSAGTLGFSGVIEFKEDPSLSMPLLTRNSVDTDAKTFNVTMTFPTCNIPCSVE